MSQGQQNEARDSATESAALLRGGHSRGLRTLRAILTNPVLLVVGLLVWLMSWVIASPVGGAPDEDFHGASLWCQSSDQNSHCERGYLLDGTRVVKIYKAFDLPCFAHDPGLTPSCQKQTSGTFFTFRVNNGDYPPVYYALMGHLTSPRIVVSTLAIRAVNALIFSLLISLVYWLARPPVRNAMVVALGLGLIPVGGYFIASINPSSWAITGIAVQFFALLALGGVSSRGRSIGLAALAVLGVGLAASARGDASAYAVGVSIICGWLIFPSLKKRLWLLVPLAAPLVAAALTIPAARQVTGGVAGATPTNNGAYNFFNILELPMGNLGVGDGFGGLGWLDTPMPALTWVLTTLVLGATLLVGLDGVSWRRGLAVFGVAVGLIGLPYYVLESAGIRVPEFVQPRYVLPLLIVLLGVLAWRPPKERPRGPSVLPLAALAAIVVAHSAALYANLLRYTNGMRPYLLGSEVSWWWSATVPPQLVWLAGSIGFAVLLLGLGLARTGVGEDQLKAGA